MEQDLPLRDIHLPDPLSWWPLAPGWWILLGLLLVLFVLLIRWLFTEKTPSKRGLQRQLQKMLDHLQQEKSDKAFVEALSALLKGVAVERYGAEVAGLSGEAWLGFLDQHWVDNTIRESKHSFSQGTGRVLLTAPYQKHVDIDRQALMDLASEWLLATNKHRSA